MSAYDDEIDISEGLDPEGPSAEDLDRFGDETLTCPHCSAEVWDQARECHVCGGRLDERPNAGPPMPMWAWITVFVVLALIVLVWVL